MEYQDSYTIAVAWPSQLPPWKNFRPSGREQRNEAIATSSSA